MKKGNLIVLTVLLLTVLTACATPKIVKLTGVVNRVEYVNNYTFVHYELDNLGFDEDSPACSGSVVVDVLADTVSQSVSLGQTVHVQCYCDSWNVIPANACTLIQDEK